MEAVVQTFFKEKKNEFLFKIHKALSKEEQKIEPEFYEKWSSAKSAPVGVHYEIEIISPKIREHRFAGQIHVHPSVKSQKDFICWTGQISETHIAAMLIGVWALGTTYTMETGIDFAYLLEKHKLGSADFDQIETVLKETYKISLPYAKYNFR